jgi:hypothetical protein
LNASKNATIITLLVLMINHIQHEINVQYSPWLLRSFIAIKRSVIDVNTDASTVNLDLLVE